MERNVRPTERQRRCPGTAEGRAEGVKDRGHGWTAFAWPCCLFVQVLKCVLSEAAPGSLVVVAAGTLQDPVSQSFSPRVAPSLHYPSFLCLFRTSRHHPGLPLLLSSIPLLRNSPQIFVDLRHRYASWHIPLHLSQLGASTKLTYICAWLINFLSLI